MPPSSRVTASPLDDAVLARYIELSAQHYGVASKSANPRHNGWKFQDSPAGLAVHFGLTRDGEDIGHILLQRRDLRYAERRFRGGFTADFLVNSEKAKATDALKLVAAVPRAAGFDFVYQTYNKNSAPLYEQIKRFIPNYVERFSLSPFGLPLRARRPLASIAKVDLPGIDYVTAPWRLVLSAFKAPRGVQPSTEWPSEEELSRLLDRFAGSAGLHTFRDSEVLRWRFGEGTLFNGRLTFLRADGALVGYYATTITEFAGAKFMALMDAVVDPRTSKMASVAIKRLALVDALEAKADMLFAMFNPRSPVAKELMGFPFLPLPDRLMMHRTPIFVIDVDRTLADIAARDDGYFLLTDLDYF